MMERTIGSGGTTCGTPIINIHTVFIVNIWLQSKESPDQLEDLYSLGVNPVSLLNSRLKC